LGGIVLAIAFVIVTRVFDLRAEAVRLLEWIEGFGPWAAVVFVVVDMLAVPLVLPTLPLTLGAGFIFGAGPGTLYCLVARTLGGTISFMIARYLFSDRISRTILQHKKLHIADEALSQEGGRVVFLTRLVPFFPGKLSNYFFGLSRCPLRGFFFGSFLGMIPITLANVYLGSLAGDLATLGARDQPRTPLQWVLDGAGLFSALAATVALAHFAQSRLRRYSGEASKD
jgi:uncharacterized membrane protein YdjX (TVP38/TMEM64 family)